MQIINVSTVWFTHMSFLYQTFRVKEILVRLQARLLAFKEAFFHIFFILNAIISYPSEVEHLLSLLLSKFIGNSLSF